MMMMMMMMMIRGHSGRSSSAMRSLLLSTLSICSNLMQSSSKNCDPVLGALGPRPALSNPDKAHMPSASLPISRYNMNFKKKKDGQQFHCGGKYSSRSVAGRVAVALLVSTPSCRKAQARITCFWASRLSLSYLPLHGHVQDVQRKVARQCHPCIPPNPAGSVVSLGWIPAS